MKQTIYILFICLWHTIATFAQSDNILISNVTPPSPHAQSLLKVGHFPVSRHTGVPDITIPLHTIRLKDFSFPVSLSYNASGIKVNEEATRVGLGWTLNAGGVVTHTVRGRYQDFCEWAYFNSPPDNQLQDIKNIYHMDTYLTQGAGTSLPFALPQGMSHETLYRALTSEKYVECGGTELAPDIFHYQFPGYSGKFIFSHSGNIVKEKEDNVRITPLKENDAMGHPKLIGWIMAAPDGTEYRFEQTEQTVFADRPRAESYFSAFYLTQIKTAGGAVATLSYKTEKRYLASFSNIEDDLMEQYITTDMAYYDVAYLDKISYPGGCISFEYAADRLDYSPEVRLSAICINDASGNNLSKWELTQGYFVSNSNRGSDVPPLDQLNRRLSSHVYYNSTWNNGMFTQDWNTKRLKLTGLKHTASGVSSPESYSFSYNEAALPTKLSAARDHWGYYNGANNKSLIPTYCYNSNQKDNSIILNYGGSADREPNPAYAQAFQLQQITYPTGGTAEFVFESNVYKTDDFEQDPYKKDLMYHLQEVVVSGNQQQGLNNIPFVTTSFTISKNNQPFPLSIKMLTDHSLYGGITELEISIRRNVNDASPLWKYGYNSTNLPNPQHATRDTLVTNYWSNITLPAGTYVLYVGGSLLKQLKSVEASGKLVTYPDDYIATHPYSIGGGLRVKEICYRDTDNKVLHTKKHYYSTNNSFADYYTSGRLMAYPRYKKDYRSTGINGFREDGYSVGYSTVYTEDFDKDGNKVGLQEYHYMNIPDKHLCYSWWDDRLPYGTGIEAKDENPQGVGAYKYSENGTLLKEVVYAYKNGSYTKKRETVYTYGGLGDGPYIIWGIQKAPILANGRENSPVCYEENAMKTLVDIYGSDAGSALNTKIPNGYLYPAIRPMQKMLNKKMETRYEDNGQFTLVTTYEQDPVHFLNTSETLVSDGETLKRTEYTYPFDKPGDAVMKRLVDDNRILEPVEVNEESDGSLKQVSYEYALFGNIPRLSAAKRNTGAGGALETRVTCHKYDAYGNPLHVSADETGDVTFLWSYQGMYPVAKIENATYDEVKSALGVAPESLSSSAAPNMIQIDGLRSKLGKAHVTTYTHRPQMGLLTETSPAGTTTYYGYDNFGRLSEVWLMEGSSKKVLQSYEYNYVNP